MLTSPWNDSHRPILCHLTCTPSTVPHFSIFGPAKPLDKILEIFIGVRNRTPTHVCYFKSSRNRCRKVEKASFLQSHKNNAISITFCAIWCNFWAIFPNFYVISHCDPSLIGPYRQHFVQIYLRWAIAETLFQSECNMSSGAYNERRNEMLSNEVAR